MLKTGSPKRETKAMEEDCSASPRYPKPCNVRKMWRSENHALKEPFSTRLVS